MATVRDYLRLFRAQTAAVEGAGFPLAAWIGGAPLWTLPFFALLGVVAHFAGFGMNSITDLRYDRLDPSKKDHPVVAGTISEGYALMAVLLATVIGLGLYWSLALTGSAGPSLLSSLSFMLYIMLGVVYNTVGKSWKPGAVLEISGAFALAFLACGTVWTGHATDLVWAVAAYAFVFTAFQIAVAGELKEIAQPNEKNLLRRLGSRVGPGLLGALSPGLAAAVDGGVTVNGDVRPFLLTSRNTWALGLGLATAKAVAITVIVELIGVPYWDPVAVGFAMCLAFYAYTFRLLAPGHFDRSSKLRLMGLGEAGSYLVLVLALAPLLWPWLLPAFLVLPVMWFGVMNRLLWARTGSSWAPGV